MSRSAVANALAIALLATASSLLGVFLARRPQPYLRTPAVALNLSWPSEVTVPNLDGDPETLSLRSTTLALVLSSECDLCTQNFSNWTTLIEGGQAKPQPLRVLGLSISSAEATRAYLSEREANFQTYLVHGRLKEELGIVGTPATVVVDSDGNVTMWLGVLDADSIATISDRLFAAVEGS